VVFYFLGKEMVMAEDINAAFEDLQNSFPSIMEAFRQLHEKASGAGVLSEKTKRLMMIAISVAIRCEPCIRSHVAGAIELGASSDEILEAAGVSILMGGGPSAAYCALYLMEELENRKLR
jgi:AhpD family alkylhydroperoxidase